MIREEPMSEPIAALAIVLAIAMRARSRASGGNSSAVVRVTNRASSSAMLIVSTSRRRRRTIPWMTAPTAIAIGILGQAWPIVIGQFAAISFGVMDTVMTGRSSAADLAAMAIGASVYGSVFMGLMGCVSALNPIIAQEYGARRHAAIGASFAQGLWVALLLSAVGCPLLAFPGPWLALIGPAPDVHALSTSYLQILALGLPGALLFRAVSALNTAISRPKTTMAIQFAGLALKLALNYLLVFGALGMPRLGAVGCAVASAVAYWALFATGWTITRLDPTYRHFGIHFAWPRWRALREHLRLGIPMGLGHGIEATSFTFMALLIAPLGTNVTGGHQITMNLAALTFQFAFALGVATGTLTAQAIGAGDLRHARATGWTGIGLGAAAATLLAAILWVLRGAIVSLYTSDPVVAGVALSLIGYLIAFHVFDAVQGIAGFVLRAYKIAIVPTIVYAVVLWGVGLVGGYVVAFHAVLGPPRGAAGMWLMQALAVALTSALLVGFCLWVLGQRRWFARAPAVSSRAKLAEPSR
jgi:MATE family multidrug resistance protein